MKDVFAILPTSFGKSLIFQLFPWVEPLRNGQASAHDLHDYGGLSSSCCQNERPSWTFLKNQSCSNDNRYWRWRSHKELESTCTRLCVHTICNICTFAIISVFGISNWKILWQNIWPPNSKQEVKSHNTFSSMKFHVPVVQMCLVESLHLVPPF